MLQYDQWRIDKNWKEISQFLMENEKAKIKAAKQGGCFQTGRAFMWTHERFVKKFGTKKTGDADYAKLIRNYIYVYFSRTCGPRYSNFK